MQKVLKIVCVVILLPFSPDKREFSFSPCCQRSFFKHGKGGFWPTAPIFGQTDVTESVVVRMVGIPHVPTLYPLGQT